MNICFLKLLLVSLCLISIYLIALTSKNVNYITRDDLWLPQKVAKPLSTGFETIDHPKVIPNSPISSNTPIRKWGCNRNESIFVFIHIGKAGGGNIRPRIAGAALNYTRERWSDYLTDQHYYPAPHKATFCNSRIPNFRIPDSKFVENFEGTLQCTSSFHPLGNLQACHLQHGQCGQCFTEHENNTWECGIVYVGHNLLGSELHYMPPSLVPQASPLSPPEDCPLHPSFKNYRRKNFLPKCSDPNQVALTDTQNNFASFYAQLPVLRVTLLREPWSWFISKFFWHGRTWNCDDIDAAVDEFSNETAMHNGHWNRGWLYHDAYLYLLYLCGEDCAARHELKKATLEELEAQAADNLKQSIAVVGILEAKDQEQFFDMIDARVDYMDMHLNKIIGGMHRSAGGKEKKRCQIVYRDESFREKLRERLPVIRSLERLYKLGVDVNRAQIKDLQQCSEAFREKYPEDEKVLISGQR